MRRMSRIAGIQMYGPAMVLSCVRNEPIQQGTGKPPGPLIRQGGKVVDVQHLTPSQKLGEAKTCHTFYYRLMSEREDLVRLRLLASDLR